MKKYPEIPILTAEIATGRKIPVLDLVYEMHLSNDSEIQHFIEHIWQRGIDQPMLDFYEEGKRQGNVNLNLSQEGILAYTAIFHSLNQRSKYSDKGKGSVPGQKWAGGRAPAL